MHECKDHCAKTGERSLLRIAVPGCSRIGGMHAADIAAHPRAKPAAAYDTRGPSAQAVAARRGVRAMSSANGRRALILAEAAMKCALEGRLVKISVIG